jgi:hypothetical protein
MKYKCPCCGYYTFQSKLHGGYEQCPVCFWADDLRQLENANLRCLPNRVSLNEARDLYKQNGICDDSIADAETFVRSPNEDELTGIDTYL